MKSCIVPIAQATPKMRGRILKVLPTLLGILLNTRVIQAQQTPDPADQDRQTIRMLLQRVEQLEARVTQLEAVRQRAAAVVPTQMTQQSSTPPEPEADTPTLWIGSGPPLSSKSKRKGRPVVVWNQVLW